MHSGVRRVGLEKAHEGQKGVLIGVPDDAAFDADDRNIDAVGVLVPLNRAVQIVQPKC